MFKFTCTKLPM